MTTMVRHTGASLVPDVLGWLEAAMPFGSRHPLAVEEFTDDRGYVLRAELPGRDPQEDISVTVANGNLTIAAKREQAKHDDQRTEFQYGSISRIVSLPTGVKPGDVSANYYKGILEIRIPVNQPAAPHRVPITFSGKN